MKAKTCRFVQQSPGAYKLTPAFTHGITPKVSPQTSQLQVALGGKMPPEDHKFLWTDLRTPPILIDGKFDAVDVALNPVRIGRHTKYESSGRGLVLFDLDYHGVLASLSVYQGQDVFLAQHGTQVLLIVHPNTVLRLKASAVANLEGPDTDFAIFFENIDKQVVVPWDKYMAAEKAKEKREAAEKVKLEAAQKPAPVMSNKAKAAVVAPKVAAQAKVQSKPAQAKPPVIRKKNWKTLGDPRQNARFADIALKDLGLALDSAVKKAQAKSAVNVDELVVA